MDQIRRSDLKGFDRTAQDLILEAQAKGARVKVSKRGHAILFGPNGGTAGVPPKVKTLNRSYQNTVADIRRLFR